MSSLVGFPEPLVAALSLRSSPCTVPVDVERTLRNLPRLMAARPAASQTGRFGNLSFNSQSPRSGGSGWRGSSSPMVSEDGFVTVGGGGGSARRRGPMGAGGGVHRMGTSSDSLASMVSNRSDEVRTPAPTDGVPRFSSAAVKAVGDVEDRMLVRIKGKINKMGHGTYDATKAFLEQILSGDETDFLDEMMKFIFQKAAMETMYCGIYARLLHELADEFGHIRTVMVSIFRTYLDIFREVAAPETTDTEASEYKAFVEAQERKKFRRGYSQFVAELVKLGEAPVDDFRLLLVHLVEALEAVQSNPDATLLTEEYIDCLAKMCGAAADILATAEWSSGIQSRLAAIVKKPKGEVPAFSNKARFALMDLAELGARGWK